MAEARSAFVRALCLRPAPFPPASNDEVFLAAVLEPPDQVLGAGNATQCPAQACHPVHIPTSAAALRELDADGCPVNKSPGLRARPGQG